MSGLNDISALPRPETMRMSPLKASKMIPSASGIAAGLGIGGEIVPSALTADLKRIYDLPNGLCDHRLATRQQKNRPDRRRGSFHSHS